MIGFILPLVARLGVPERFRNAAAYVLLAIAAIALIWAGWAILKASIIEDHEQEKVIESIKALDSAAEERANDAIRDLMTDQDRSEAIEEAAKKQEALPPEERATLPPTTVALNCKRIAQAYTKEQLEKLAVYQEKCT